MRDGTAAQAPRPAAGFKCIRTGDYACDLSSKTIRPAGAKLLNLPVFAPYSVWLIDRQFVISKQGVTGSPFNVVSG
jgi:hypothetical protein